MGDKKAMSTKVALLLLGVAVLSSGCVKRTILVETDPPGAQLWINGTVAGKTPVTHEFITHGPYKFRIEKAGFRTMTPREFVRAPIYQWIPLDFIFEWLLPVKLEDKHQFRYTLAPQPVEEKLELETEASREQVLADLKSPDPLVRRQACITLAARRNPVDAPHAREALKDTDPRVRAAALSALRSMEGAGARDTLLEVMRSDPAKEVRWQAAVELEALNDPQALPGLIEGLKDPDPLVRTGAAEALKALPNPAPAVPALTKALREKDAGVRRAAAEALGKAGDQSAVPALVKALFHRDVHTRRHAAKSLALLKDASAAPAFVRTLRDWDPAVRRTATDTIVALGDTSVVPSLLKQLRSWKPWTREYAAMALGGLKDPRAKEPLRKALARENDFSAKIAIQKALELL
jgi:HEAT repeat protein